MNDLRLAKSYCNKAKQSADRGIEFELSFRRFKQLKLTRRCFYTGEELTEANFTLDRIDASIGYTDENTVACCDRVNQNKRALTLADIQSIAKALKRRGMLNV